MGSFYTNERNLSQKPKQLLVTTTLEEAADLDNNTPDLSKRTHEHMNSKTLCLYFTNHLNLEYQYFLSQKWALTLKFLG